MLQLVHVMKSLKNLLPNVRIPDEQTRKLDGTVYTVCDGVVSFLVKNGRPEFFIVRDTMGIYEEGSRIAFLVAVIGKEITILVRGNEYLGHVRQL